ncbi:MAG: dockerin type I repeat-containing protein [Muribaculaceae bacterium]|nr:dockerin type I repeat-containing protein [Muribaculaceae bacterium]
MKKSLLFSLFALMAVMAMAATYPASYYTLAPETATVVGDVNCDQAVTAADVTELYNYLLNNSTTYLSTSDINGDGNVTAADVTAVYDVLLNGSSGSSTTITMNEYISATSSGTPTKHVWKNTEDVIYITLDGVEENMYVLVRSGGKWTLKDITGSNKAGFKTNGTIKAMWVRGANWSSDQVGDLNIPQDLAFGSGTYSCSNKTVGINLPLELYESKIILGGTNVNTSTSMTYCRHITSLQSINSFIDGGTSENEYVTYAPKAKLINGQYVIYARHEDINSSGKTVFHVTLPDTRSFRYTANFKFKPGQDYTLMNPGPGTTGWTRDFVIGYSNSAYSHTYSFITLNDNGSTNQITIPVGYELNLVPKEGGTSIYEGTVQNLQVSNTTCVTTYNSSFVTPTICAQEVGTSLVYFKYTTPYGDTFTYSIKVTVYPSIWLYGYTTNNNKRVPTIYYNMRGTSAPKISDDSGSQELASFSMSKGHAAAIVKGSSTCKVFKNSYSPYYYGSYNEKYDIGLPANKWVYMDPDENIYYNKASSSGEYFYVMKNNTVMLTNNNPNRPYSGFKVDYTTGKIACECSYGNSSELYILGIGLVRADYGYNNLQWGPNGTSTGERITYYYSYAFGSDRLILRVHRQKTQFGEHDNEMIYTNNYYVYTYNSVGTQLSSPTFNENGFKSSMFYDGNTLFCVSNSSNGQFTTTVGNSVNTVTTNKKGICEIGYKDGYVYGVRCVNESGKSIYYFFFGTLSQVLNNTCTEINLGEYPGFNLNGIFFETSKN